MALSNSAHLATAAEMQAWSRPGRAAAGASRESLISSTTAHAALASEDVAPNSAAAASAAATAALAWGDSAREVPAGTGRGLGRELGELDLHRVTLGLGRRDERR